MGFGKTIGHGFFRVTSITIERPLPLRKPVQMDLEKIGIGYSQPQCRQWEPALRVVVVHESLLEIVTEQSLEHKKHNS